MCKYRVLVVGGYGFFGRRLVDRLSRDSDLHVQVAGRSGAEGQAFVSQLADASKAQLEATVLDTRMESLTDELKRLAPHVAVNASGPFQGADYRFPLACIAAGVHYVDLADAREYVSGFSALHTPASDAGVCVVSGASSVPALSSAAADRLVAGLFNVDAIDIGISPGNRTERGVSTVQGILSYCGKPLPGRAPAPTFGWMGTRRHRYAKPVGVRLLSPCDVPDLTLLPQRYAGTPVVRFEAGLELGFLHRGMNLMAWMVRMRLVNDWSRHAPVLKAAADQFRHWGSDAGAMHVAVRGRDMRGAAVSRTWQLVATHGHGPFVPTLAAAAMVRKLKKGQAVPGASPCIGLLNLDDFTREMDGLSIRTETAG
jgi:hypothetical protein